MQKQTETLLLDKDVLDWIKGEFGDWQGHINELLRFHMDTSRQREEAFEEQPEPTPAPGQGLKLGL